ncbi:hypothetical protein [Ktedonobacter sp. SOSP1-52]|uniref:hypothetical protein n=1 Tax=Ktedonobacter sp. SOSP1-52 TaxID=2778366 RepID=UPI001914F4EE|nr:hypothetical protein [Ktedonobacter sp. SOSP1-52]
MLFLHSARAWFLASLTLLFCSLPCLVACSATVTSSADAEQTHTMTINQDFQQDTLATTSPTYRCGAWASNNAPASSGTITIYARLTHDVAGVAGMAATATVHFRYGDVVLTQHPTSDTGGYVSFNLPLLGRQPVGIPATADVVFTLGQETLTCAPAFFTPE